MRLLAVMDAFDSHQRVKMAQHKEYVDLTTGVINFYAAPAQSPTRSSQFSLCGYVKLAHPGNFTGRSRARYALD
jgi:hypothetical protein